MKKKLQKGNLNWLLKVIFLLQAVYWPPEKPQDQQSYDTAYDTSNIHRQTFALPNLEADREYVLAVQVKTTGGPSPGSEQVQFKTTEGSKCICSLRREEIFAEFNFSRFREKHLRISLECSFMLYAHTKTFRFVTK